jgi:hypothetical protein
MHERFCSKPPPSPSSITLSVIALLTPAQWRFPKVIGIPYYNENYPLVAAPAIVTATLRPIAIGQAQVGAVTATSSTSSSTSYSTSSTPSAAAHRRPPLPTATVTATVTVTVTVTASLLT